jgi:hypothetical protein
MIKIEMDRQVEILYIKKGRRYIPWGNALSDGDKLDRNPMRAGSNRLTHCVANGHFRYTYDVNPDHAKFLAAADTAKDAMIDAITGAAKAKPVGIEKWTPEQQEIIKRFHEEMSQTGAFAPTWLYPGAHEIAQAGIDAVRKAAGLLR